MASLGRGMARAALLWAMAVLLLLQAYQASAVVYNVGDRAAWTLPSIDYSLWARRKPIRVNDVLRFTYSPELHNVVMVNQADYYNCASQSPLAVYANGNTMVRLARRGTYYFICSIPGHCEAGMKMQVTVS